MFFLTYVLMKIKDILKLLNKKVDVNLENKEVLIKEITSDFGNDIKDEDEEIQKVQVL